MGTSDERQETLVLGFRSGGGSWRLVDQPCPLGVVGELSLTYERMELLADPGLTLFAYTADPGSRSEEALNLLASWTATLDQTEPADVTDR